MKHVVSYAAAALLCLLPVFSAVSPSIDGRAIVAESGELPSGMFAKAAGYLPGDTVTVTNPATGVTVDVMVLGALDPSEGIAIKLSQTAADKLFIAKDSNAQVKITRRVGNIDENVTGSAVVSVAPEETASALPEEIRNTVEFETVPEIVSIVDNSTAEPAPAAAADEVPSVAEEPAAAEDTALAEETAAEDTEKAIVLVTDEDEPADESAAAENEPVAEPESEEGLFVFRVEDPEEAAADTAAAEEPAEPAPAAVEDEETAAALPAEPEETPPAREEIVLVPADEYPAAGTPAEEPPAEAPAPRGAASDSEIVLVPTGMNPPPEGTAAAAADSADAAEHSDKAEPEAVPAETPSAEEIASADGSESDTAVDGADSSESIDILSDMAAKSDADDTADAIALEPEAVFDDEPSEPASLPALSADGDFHSRVVPALDNLESGKYYVQIAVTDKEAVLNDLQQKYGSVYPLVYVPRTSGTSYQVLVGPLSVDEYGVVMARFKEYGYTDAFLRKIR